MVGHLVGWLYTNVWGNLVASAIGSALSVTAAAVWHHRRLARHHQAIHEKLDRLLGDTHGAAPPP
jgi:hypothetical protein